jgi:hypothetical protein
MQYLEQRVCNWHKTFVINKQFTNIGTANNANISA